MDQILDVEGNEIILDIHGDHIVLSSAITPQKETLQIQIETSEVNDSLPTKIKSESKQRRSKQKITLEFITSILTDKYHNSMTVSEIKSKYGIGHDVYKFINSYSEVFINKFGKKKKIITTNELEEYWKDLKI